MHLLLAWSLSGDEELEGLGSGGHCKDKLQTPKARLAGQARAFGRPRNWSLTGSPGYPVLPLLPQDRGKPRSCPCPEGSRASAPPPPHTPPPTERTLSKSHSEVSLGKAFPDSPNHSTSSVPLPFCSTRHVCVGVVLVCDCGVRACMWYVWCVCGVCVACISMYRVCVCVVWMCVWYVWCVSAVCVVCDVCMCGVCVVCVCGVSYMYGVYVWGVCVCVVCGCVWHVYGGCACCVWHVCLCCACTHMYLCVLQFCSSGSSVKYQPWLAGPWGSLPSADFILPAPGSKRISALVTAPDWFAELQPDELSSCPSLSVDQLWVPDRLPHYPTSVSPTVKRSYRVDVKTEWYCAMKVHGTNIIVFYFFYFWQSQKEWGILFPI